MKKAFRPKVLIPWRTICLFTLLAVIWHLPLLLSRHSNSKFKIQNSKFKIQNRNVSLVFQSAATDALENPLPLQDPTVYLLPNKVGFLRRSRQASMEPRVTTENLLSPPPIEPFQAERLGGGFPVDQASSWLLVSSVDGGRDISPMAFSHENTTSGESAWYVTGLIKDRKLTHPDFPHIRSSELLGATILRIGVNPQGNPQFVLLEAGCGSDQGDEAGIRFARSLSFASSDNPADSPVAWGHLKILWQAEDSPR